MSCPARPFFFLLTTCCHADAGEGGVHPPFCSDPILSYLRQISRLVPDCLNKINFYNKTTNRFFVFPVHIKATFTVYRSATVHILTKKDTLLLKTLSTLWAVENLVQIELFDVGLPLTCNFRKLSYLHNARNQGIPAVRTGSCAEFAPYNCLSFILCSL